MESIKQCLYSIGDNNAFLRGNRDPCDAMILLLKKYFDPKKASPSLAIKAGMHGSRVTHDHENQFHFVLQSLLLWQKILNDMFRLWFHAQDDLLNPENPYRLCDTGQGLNRLQGTHPPL